MWLRVIKHTEQKGYKTFPLSQSCTGQCYCETEASVRQGTVNKHVYSQNSLMSKEKKVTCFQLKSF